MTHQAWIGWAVAASLSAAMACGGDAGRGPTFDDAVEAAKTIISRV